MYIDQKAKAILLNLKNPERVTSVLPKKQWRDVVVKGKKLLAVAHHLDAVKLLRNLGIDAPSPINYYYEHRKRVTPFFAQRKTMEFLTLNDRAFVLNDLGTGKTLSALWTFDYLRSRNMASKMLVIAPLSTLDRTWGDEIFRNLPHLNYAVLHGSRERRLRLLESPADVYIINHDGVKVIAEELKTRHDIDVVVVDELASFRNQSTDRWKALKSIVVDRQRVWGMTGTPTPNDPTDAWAQIRLIKPEAVPPYFTKFRDMVMRQASQYVWLPKEGALDVVNSVMQPAVRFTREQCVDLPPAIYQTRSVDLSPDQKRMYKEMVSKLHAEHAGGQITAVNEAVKLMKLIQICCGVAYDNTGDNLVIEAGERVKVLKEIIENAGTKVIVFVPLTGALNHIVAELRTSFTVEAVNGAVSSKERSRIFADFQNSKDPRVLVAQPAAMSHGLTLTAASTIVWFAPITSTEVYTQANGRITRPSQKHTQFIIHIEGSDVERRIYDRLTKKQAMQGALLDMFAHA